MMLLNEHATNLHIPLENSKPPSNYFFVIWEEKHHFFTSKEFTKIQIPFMKENISFREEKYFFSCK